MPAENLSVRLRADIRDKVDAIARRSRRTRSFVIAEAVTTYVEAQERYAREIAEAVASAETGIGHTRDQAFAWMDSWRDGGGRNLPEPDVTPTRKP